MAPLSLEALQELAFRVRAAGVARVRARLRSGGDPHAQPTGLPPAPAGASLAPAYPTARAADHATGVLLAEAAVADALRGPERAYIAAWTKSPVTLPRDATLGPDAVVPALISERNEHRRAALALAADTAARDNLRAAQPVVEALRALGPALGLAAPADLYGALGEGDAGALERASDAVLAATEDAFHELDLWVRPRLGLGRTGALTWPDRLRTLAGTESAQLVPGGDRAGIATRWMDRIGLGHALARLRNETAAPAATGAGVRALSERPGESVVLAGTPTIGGLALHQFAGAAGEGLALALPREPGFALRLGTDRVHLALGHALARRLLLDRGFVVREASVDRARREPVLLEHLHIELFVTRARAALARFALDVLARTPDLPGRLREGLARAVGSAPAPAWAAHVATRGPELRAGAATTAALLEPRVFATLRERHDEDWYRNPRAGETLSGTLDAMRALGASTWAGDDALSPAPLAARVAELLRDARR